MTSLVFVIVLLFATTVTIQTQLAYSWPAETTEADKEEILSARSIDDLPLEQYSIAIDRIDEFFNAYVPDTKEWQDLLDCGYVDREPFEVLQCLEDKGHPVR